MTLTTKNLKCQKHNSCSWWKTKCTCPPSPRFAFRSHEESWVYLRNRSTLIQLEWLAGNSTVIQQQNKTDSEW